MEHSLDKLRDLIETLRKGEVGEFEYEDETIRLRINMGHMHVQRATRSKRDCAHHRDFGVVSRLCAGRSAERCRLRYFTVRGNILPGTVARGSTIRSTGPNHRKGPDACASSKP